MGLNEEKKLIQPTLTVSFNVLINLRAKLTKLKIKCVLEACTRCPLSESLRKLAKSIITRITFVHTQPAEHAPICLLKNKFISSQLAWYTVALRINSNKIH